MPASSSRKRAMHASMSTAVLRGEGVPHRRPYGHVVFGKVWGAEKRDLRAFRASDLRDGRVVSRDDEVGEQPALSGRADGVHNERNARDEPEVLPGKSLRSPTRRNDSQDHRRATFSPRAGPPGIDTRRLASRSSALLIASASGCWCFHPRSYSASRL